MQSILLVGLGGALGAMGRYGVGVWVGRLHSSPFPLGTFTVNIIGSLAMGLLIGVLTRLMPPWQNEARLLVAVGLLGGFTTFSAYSLDIVTLIERHQAGVAFFYALISVLAGVAALFAGLFLARVGA